MKLENAIEEIFSIYNCITDEKFPYFLIVGAGVSAPEIPLASQIIDDCKRKCKSNPNYEQFSIESKYLSAEEKYSFWLNKAYPSKEPRRQYFSQIVKKAKITSSNLQIANILSSKKLFNLVVTTNFDNQIEKALNFLNFFDYYSSENEIDNLSINLRNDDVQIIKVHGDYKNYNFKNLDSEIKRITYDNSILSMGDMLQEIFKNRSPIIIGYSGWENDVIMKTMKNRLLYDVPYKYYWFCYSIEDYEVLPEWIKNNNNVEIVYPEEKIDSIAMSKFKNLGMIITDNYNLPSSKVLAQIVDRFKIGTPSFLDNPLLPCENLINSLSKSENVYNFEGWIDKYKALRKINQSNNKLVEELKQSFNEKNFNKYISCLTQLLSKESSIGDSTFNKICKDYLQVSIESNELQEKHKIKLTNFAFNIPTYRNNKTTRKIAILANLLYYNFNKNCKIQTRFNKLLSYYNGIHDSSFLVAIHSKMIIMNNRVSSEEFELTQSFFSNEISIVEFHINMDIFPEYIILATIESLKKNDKKLIISLLEKLADENMSVLYKNKRIKSILKYVINILIDVDGFDSNVYDVIKEKYFI